jgi:prepilin signal peptidase PulO-like enzyme (type II secretory pathway)
MIYALSIAREGIILLALIIGTIKDIRKREVSNLSLILIICAGIITFNVSFLIESAVLLVGFCILIVAKKQDIGFGGGDIKVLVTLAFAAGLMRALLALVIGFLILMIINKIKYKRFNVKKEVALIPFLSAGHIILLVSVVISAFV